MPEPELQRRRQAAADAWSLSDEVVLIGAGTPISIPGGADQCFSFKPHPEYRWLAERRREGGVLAFDPSRGWELFEPPITETELVWGGGEPPVGRSLGELNEWVGGRKVRWLGTPSAEIPGEVSDELREALLHARRPKDDSEIDRMRRAARATAAGHAAARQAIRPGATERQVQIEIEAAFFRAGADCTGYGTIVGTGPNSAVFHFVPGQRMIAENDLVLVDAGAEVDGYVIDVTRTYPASGEFTSEQQTLYDAVLKSELVAMDMCRVGVEWLDVHRATALSLSASLREMGMFTCSPEEAVESELIGLFFPHGVGHMVGLGVRDAGGPLPGRKGESRVGGIRVRMDLPLEAGYAVTIEPGLYFIPALLNDPKRREKYAAQVNWTEVEPWIGNGGIRIEDNVLVTTGEPLNLTSAIPK